MSDYLLSETGLSGDDYSDHEIVEPLSNKDIEFIDDSDLQEKEDVDFYRRIDKKIMLTVDETPVPILKREVGRLSIDSDSRSNEYEEEEVQIGIPNCDEDESNEDEQIIRDGLLPVYGTDNYEWNHNEKPKGDVCDFKGNSSYLASSFYLLYKLIKGNADVKKFLPMAKNYVSEVTPLTAKILKDLLKDEDDSSKIKEAKNGSYLMLLYALRHVGTGKYYHTTDFSCLDKDMLKSLKV